MDPLPNGIHAKDIIIRQATVADAWMVLRLSRSIISDSDFNVTTPEEFTIGVEEEGDWINGFVKDKNSILLLAVEQNEVVGMLNFRGSPRKRLRHTGTIGLGILKRCRGMGIGTLLMGELINWASKHRVIEKLELNVFEKNLAARALYQKMGFVEQGFLTNGVKLEDGSYTNVILMARFVK